MNLKKHLSNDRCFFIHIYLKHYDFYYGQNNYNMGLYYTDITRNVPEFAGVKENGPWTRSQNGFKKTRV